MSKKVKLIAIMEVEDDVIFDEFMMKRTLGQLGEITSFSVNDHDKGGEASQSATQNQDMAITHISEFINDANKIYFGTLSIENRKDVALAILHVSNLDKLANDQSKKQFKKMFND